jgi:transcriptional regulator with AAA-type ATPase domain
MKGAFTGVLARQRRVESANHGTLFLDEIGDLGLGCSQTYGYSGSAKGWVQLKPM